MKRYQVIVMFAPDTTEERIDEILNGIQTETKFEAIYRLGIKRLGLSVRHPKTKIWYKTTKYVTTDIDGEEKAAQIKEKLKGYDEIIKFLIIRTG